jgi:hypothetical protein
MSERDPLFDGEAGAHAAAEGHPADAPVGEAQEQALSITDVLLETEPEPRDPPQTATDHLIAGGKKVANALTAGGMGPGMPAVMHFIQAAVLYSQGASGQSDGTDGPQEGDVPQADGGVESV